MNNETTQRFDQDLYDRVMAEPARGKPELEGAAYCVGYENAALVSARLAAARQPDATPVAGDEASPTLNPGVRVHASMTQPITPAVEDALVEAANAMANHMRTTQPMVSDEDIINRVDRLIKDWDFAEGETIGDVMGGDTWFLASGIVQIVDEALAARAVQVPDGLAGRMALTIAAYRDNIGQEMGFEDEGTGELISESEQYLVYDDRDLIEDLIRQAEANGGEE